MNIFICTTYLHVQIALSLIAQYELTDIIILRVGTPVSDSSHWRQRCVNAFKMLNQVISLRGKVAAVYCGNYKILPCRLIVSWLAPRSCYSFDDGIGSRWGSGYFFEDDCGLLKRALLRLFRLSSYSAFWRSSIVRHYTFIPVGEVYLNKPVEKVKLLYSSETTDFGSVRGCIILGTAACDDGMISRAAYVEVLKRIIQDQDQVHYFPHPREARKTEEAVRMSFPGASIVRPNCAVEAYLQERDVAGVVYGFYSTALLTLKAMKSCQVFCVRLPEIENAMKERERMLAFFAEAGIGFVDAPEQY